MMTPGDISWTGPGQGRREPRFTTPAIAPAPIESGGDAFDHFRPGPDPWAESAGARDRRPAGRTEAGHLSESGCSARASLESSRSPAPREGDHRSLPVQALRLGRVS